MKVVAKSGKILTVKSGRIVCPVCRKRTDFSVLDDTSGSSIPVFCRQCKTETIVNIDNGQRLDDQRSE